MPSELLERRPDIAAAERRVAAANAQIGVAKAAYYPTISLGASGGFESTNITTLVQRTERALVDRSISLGNGLRRGTDVAQSPMKRRKPMIAQVASYRETVLTGFQQVEDNLAALRILENEAEVQDQAVEAAQSSLDLSNMRYAGRGHQLSGGDRCAKRGAF